MARIDAAKSGFGLDLLEFHTTELGSAETQSLKDLEARYPHRIDLNGTIEALAIGYLLIGSEAGKPADPIQPDGDDSRRTRLCHDTLAPLVQRAFRSSQASGPMARRLLETRTFACWSDGKVGEILTESQLELMDQGVPAMRKLSEDEIRLIDVSRLQIARQKAEEFARKEELNAARVKVEVAEKERAAETERRLNEQKELNAQLERKNLDLEDAKKKVEEEAAEAERQRIEAENQARLAEQRERIAFARQLTAYSQENQTDRPILATLLAAEAIRSTRDLGEPIVGSAEQGIHGLLQAFGGTSFGQHEADMTCLAFAPDGRLVTGSEDNTLRIWDLKDPRKEPVVLRGHKAEINCLAFAPDGQLVTGSSDGTARITQLDISKLLQYAAELWGENISAADWQRYFPEYEYRRKFSELPVGQGVAEAVSAGKLYHRVSSDTGPLWRIDGPLRFSPG